MNKRVGRVLVARSVVEKRGDELSKMLTHLKFKPIDTQYLQPFQDKQIFAMVYLGFSPHFEEVEEGNKIPDYLIRVIEDPSSGAIDVRFVKAS